MLLLNGQNYIKMKLIIIIYIYILHVDVISTLCDTSTKTVINVNTLMNHAFSFIKFDLLVLYKQFVTGLKSHRICHVLCMVVKTVNVQMGYLESNPYLFTQSIIT